MQQADAGEKFEIDGGDGEDEEKEEEGERM